MPAAEPCIPKPRCWLCGEPSSPTALLHFQRQRSLWIPIHTSEEKPGAGSPANSQPPVLPLQPADIGPFPQHPKEQLAAKKEEGDPLPEVVTALHPGETEPVVMGIPARA